MAKSRAVIYRERKITIIYCRENALSEIVAVLRNFNDCNLWDKSKYLWTMEDWKAFFALKEIFNNEQTKKNDRK